jgi:hypothetical protein
VMYLKQSFSNRRKNLSMQSPTKHIIKTSWVVSGLTAFLISICLATPAAALGAANSGAADNAATLAANQAALTKLKSRGDTEISRRLTTLNKLASVINGDAKLSATDKSSLTAQVNGEISDLNSLKTKLDSDTTLADAQTDVQSIITNYRVYALIYPKVHLIKAADTELATDTKLTTLANKLQQRLSTAKSQGKDVTSLQASLDDMNSKISAAQTTATNIETSDISLQPSDYNSDHTLLEGQKSQLQTAHQNNLAAYNDAKSIVSGLKSL